MPRIKIDFPEKVFFTTQTEVRISDVNYGNHLGNDSVLSLIHEARVRFFNSLGFSELDLGGASVIMSDVAIVYESEGHYADQLSIEISVCDFSSAGFDIYYRLTNLTTNKELAIAKTGMVCYDYTERKVKPVPEAFKLLFDISGKSNF